MKSWNLEILKTFEGEIFCSRLLYGGREKERKEEYITSVCQSLSNVKSTSDETSTISWELTKKKGFRAGHRNSAERKLESTNEILNSLGDDASSVSKQRATLIFYKSSLKEKLGAIQGLDEKILDLSTEEEIDSETEETDQFCSHVELVLAGLDKTLAAISSKIEVSTHMSKMTWWAKFTSWMSKDNSNQNLWVIRREGADLWCCLLWWLTT